MRMEGEYCIFELWKDRCYHQDDVFSWEAYGCVSRTIPGLILEKTHSGMAS